MLFLLNGKGKENILIVDCDLDCRYVMSVNDYIVSLRDVNIFFGVYFIGFCFFYLECYLRFV